MSVMSSRIGVYDEEPVNQFRSSMLVELWMVRCHKAARAHYMQATQHRDRNTWLTLVNAIAAIAVLFAANSSWFKNMLTINVLNSDGVLSRTEVLFDALTSLLALMVVLTTILQFIKRWGERSEQHRFAGAEFSNLQKKCERYSLVENLNMAMVHNLNRDYNHVTKSYPLVSKEIWALAGKSDQKKTNI